MNKNVGTRQPVQWLSRAAEKRSAIIEERFFIPLQSAQASVLVLHFFTKHSFAGVRSTPPSWYDLRTYCTSVESQRRCTLSQPTASMSRAVAHMQMHQLSPLFLR